MSLETICLIFNLNWDYFANEFRKMKTILHSSEGALHGQPVERGTENIPIIPAAVKIVLQTGSLPKRLFFPISGDRFVGLQHPESRFERCHSQQTTGKPPRELAQEIIDRLPRSRQVEKTEIAGPGFINFFLTMK